MYLLWFGCEFFPHDIFISCSDACINPPAFNLEVHEFYSHVHGMCLQYLIVWMILLVFCKNVCVVPGEQFLSQLNHDVHFHQWWAWSARGKRVKFRVMFLNVSFSTVS